MFNPSIFNPYFLVTLSEKEKKALIILAVIIAFIFVVIGFIHKLVKNYMNKKGKEIDGYMHELCKYKVITNPHEFKAYVTKRETKNFYLQLRWIFRIMILVSVGFFLYIKLVEDSNFKILIEALKSLSLEFGYETTTIFGMEIICDWPFVMKYPEPLLTLTGYVCYIFTFVVIIFIFSLIKAILDYNAKLKRGRVVSKTVFTKNLDETSYVDNDTLF